MRDREQRAIESITLFNSTDYDGIRAMLAPDFTYAETGTGLSVSGADDFIAALQAWKTVAPDATGEVVTVVAADDTTVLEIVWRGTQTGPLATPANVLPASGRTFEFRATLWQEWEGDKRARERHHIDVLTMLAQLGALPTPAPA